MEYLTKRPRHLRRPLFTHLLLLVFVINLIDCKVEGESSNLVSIEDSIDLDSGPSSPALTHSNGKTVTIQLKSLPGQKTGSNFKDSDDDEEEDLTSGSGSGSGDNYPMEVTNESSTNLTSTQTTPGSDEIFLVASNNTLVLKGGIDVPENITFNLDHTFADSDNDDSSDINDEDADSAYDLPGPSSVESNHVLDPPAWSKWSDWFAASITSKIRVRTCEVDGEEINEAVCDGVRMQMITCDKTNTSLCGKIQDIRALPVEGCSENYKNMQKREFLQATAPTNTPTTSKPPPTPPKAPSTDECRYSLYDTHRQKYVFTGWNLTELVTKSKVKKWCDKHGAQYLIMTTPKHHCRQYYKDLCKVSGKCRSDKPTKERGDFAEGCWRSLVYGDMLPVGLSNKQTIVYFICQRFATQSKLAKVFGYKETYFGTLYDTSARSPTLSLNKITRLGDETWPDTEYFIEHGLVETDSDVLWLFRKPRKGMLTLHDLDRCRDDESCDLGLRQVLPHDYEDSNNVDYTPTHLMWPELMPPDPDPRLATFTMTNMAPLQSSLFEEWHAAILQARRFAIEQCGIPVFFDSSFAHQPDFSTHRVNKSAMYVASGILPSTEPARTTGRDIHVPFLFWFAGCCVKQHSTVTNSMEYSNSNSSNYNKNVTSGDIVYGDEVTNITAFSLYIVNSAGKNVIPAPVLQLEMLLQDVYKSTPSDPDVTLFPGFDSACSDLKNDASRWFQN
ncbi:hypothetical protein BsWGS_08237 [Bradybaena similaris]